jgi:hypothetical protein
VEGITQTILDLTRGFLADPARETELQEILDSRDPVRLVTSRSLFREAPLALVYMEIPSLPDLVFGLRRLLDSRGLSRAISQFIEGSQETSLPTLLSGAGLDRTALILSGPRAILLLAGASHAQALAARMLANFREATGGVPAEVATENLWPDEALLGRSPDLVRPPRFGALMDALTQKLQQQRGGAAHNPPHGCARMIPGFVQRCQACDLHPATVKDDTTGEGICHGCHVRRTAARLPDPQPPAGVTPVVEEALDGADISRPGRDDRSESVAVIAAKIEEIWNLMSGLGGVDQVHLTQTALLSAVHQAVQSVAEKLGLRRRYQRHSFDVGELVLVIPANRALDGVRRLVDGIEAHLAREAEKLGGYPEIQEGLRRMRVHVGLCCAPGHYPANLAVSMASALRASARRLALRSADPEPTSTIDFWVLHDGAPISPLVDELRRQVYESRRDFHLSRRPYRFPEFKKEILEPLRAFRRVPYSEALEMRRALLMDLRSGDLNFRYQLAKSEEWRQFATEVAGKDPSRWDGLLFRAGPEGVRDTSFLDLVELAEFNE